MATPLMYTNDNILIGEFMLKTRGIMGKPVNLEMVRAVKALRRDGMTYRKIAETVGKNHKTVHCWANYSDEFIAKQIEANERVKKTA